MGASNSTPYLKKTKSYQGLINLVLASCPFCSKKFFIGRHTEKDVDIHLNDHHDETKEDQAEISAKDLCMKERIKCARENFKTIRVDWKTNRSVFLAVYRDYILDCMPELNLLTNDQLKSEFQICFVGENAADAGGLTKEWINLMIKALFQNNIGLFEQTQTEERTYMIKKNCNNHELFKVAGKIIGKAIFEGIPLPVRLCPILIHHILDKNDFSLEHVKLIDKSLYQGLNFILLNNIDNIIFQTFSVDLDDNETKNGSIRELLPDGKSIDVTDENKDAYVSLMIEFVTSEIYKADIKSLKEGIFSVFPEFMLKGLQPLDLEFMICGMPEIDIEDWKENTAYKGKYYSNHQVIIWFWQIVGKMSQEDLGLLLAFATGSSSVPVEGFKSLQTVRGDLILFTIEYMPYFPNALIRAHTCFNRIDIPEYESKELLKDSIKFAISNSSMEFNLE